MSASPPAAPLIGMRKPKPSANIITQIAALNIATNVMSYLRLHANAGWSVHFMRPALTAASSLFVLWRRDQNPTPSQV
jgi:hypothetical protein